MLVNKLLFRLDWFSVLLDPLVASVSFLLYISLDSPLLLLLLLPLLQLLSDCIGSRLLRLLLLLLDWCCNVCSGLFSNCLIFIRSVLGRACSALFPLLLLLLLLLTPPSPLLLFSLSPVLLALATKCLFTLFFLLKLLLYNHYQKKRSGLNDACRWMARYICSYVNMITSFVLVYSNE